MATEPKTVLVVDDEELLRAVIALTLSRDGYRVLVAGDYNQAMCISRQNWDELDILVTDICLPDRNGCELANALLAERPDLRVLYMSGSTGQEALELHEGPPACASFLPKPFRRAQLCEAVSRLLGDDEEIAEAPLILH
jgi:DNA-binding NtrC family response regulator